MKPASVILPIVVVAAVVAVIWLRPARSGSPTPETGGGTVPSAVTVPAPAVTGPAATVPAPRPRLLDLGADTCVPCKLMAPILEELGKEYAGTLQVDFIDVWKDHDAGVAHGISSIPTQIFFAPDGKELYRHEGFMAKEDILAQWKFLGHDLKPAPASAAPAAH